MRCGRSLLLQFGFWRVVLDEAQLVAQSSSVAAIMVSALWRRHAWVVTGTPITSRVDEIQVTSHETHGLPSFPHASLSSMQENNFQDGGEWASISCSTGL